MSLVPFVIVWAVLAAVVIVLLIYRGVVAGHEDDMLHVEDTTGALASQQEQVAKKLEVIDRWGKILTVLVVLYGLGLAAVFVYNAWTDNSRYLG